MLIIPRARSLLKFFLIAPLYKSVSWNISSIRRSTSLVYV